MSNKYINLGKPTFEHQKRSKWLKEYLGLDHYDDLIDISNNGTDEYWFDLNAKGEKYSFQLALSYLQVVDYENTVNPDFLARFASFTIDVINSVYSKQVELGFILENPNGDLTGKEKLYIELPNHNAFIWEVSKLIHKENYDNHSHLVFLFPMYSLIDKRKGFSRYITLS